jgi:hypothetical protein
LPNSDIVTYIKPPMEQQVWDEYMATMCPVADSWDLASWQLAEWGVTRIYQRFRPPEESRGVRITDVLVSSRTAEKRMRSITAWAELTDPTKIPSNAPRQAPTSAARQQIIFGPRPLRPRE